MPLDPVIAVIGTLDTKSNEIAYVRDKINALGARALVIDSGILGTPTIPADIDRTAVATAAGKTLSEVQQAGSRSAAVELMEVGLAAITRDLYQAGRLHGVLCLGGAEGALMGAAAMHALPVGVPKFIVSPSASGRREFGPFMASSDVTVMHSVIDILGLNAIARSVFDNAAAAIVGMVTWAGKTPRSDLPAVGVTMLGQTTPGAMVLVRILENAGYEPIIFHANGVGGPAMDALARGKVLAGVIDFTLSEPANSMFNGIHSTDDRRMTAAPESGIPLLVVPGAADFFNQGPIDTVEPAYRGRPMYRHNPVATLVRIQNDEMDELGKIIANRIRTATAPTAVLAPTRGFSLIGVADGPIADHNADLRLIESLERNLPTSIPVERADMDINAAAFGKLAAERFLGLMARTSAGGRRLLPERA